MVYIQRTVTTLGFVCHSKKHRKVRPETVNHLVAQGFQASSSPISVLWRSQSPSPKSLIDTFNEGRGGKNPLPRIAALCWTDRVAAWDIICSKEIVEKSLGSSSPSHAMLVAAQALRDVLAGFLLQP